MADEKERVQYEFQGDVSSLRKATTDAIGMLDKFQDNMNKLNSDGIVKASQRAQSGFQNSVNRMVKGVVNLQKKLKSVGDIKMPKGTEAFDATKQAVDTLESTLNKLNSSNTITSKSLNAMKAELNNVTAGLKSAGPSFDTLISKEAKFQKHLEITGNVANQFSSKVQGATNKVQSTFSAMGTFVGSKLSSIGAFFEPLVAKIQSFKDRAAIAGNRVAQVFTTVAAAFRRTSDGTEGASSSQSRFGKVLDSIKEKLNKHQEELKETSDGYKGMEGASSGASLAMSAGAAAISKSFEAVKNVVSGVVDSLFALAGVEVGNLLSEGAKGAIDYVENLNLFEVAMGSSIDKGKAFVDQMQEVYGMDPSNIYRYAGYFYQLTDAIGMSAEASSAVSLSMTKASNDLASLFNKDIETVVDDLSAGMMGMSRSVKKYGMDIRVATLQETAYNYGLTEQVENMSEANRQALRFITMLGQVDNALHQSTEAVDGASTEMGDFARNIETPANQLRIFKEQMSQLGRAIGTFIMQPIQAALPYINGFVMALRVMINTLATLMGVSVKSGASLSSAGDSAEEAAGGVGAISNAADKASKKLKQLIAPFDELNVLQESTGDSGGGGALIPDDALDPALAKALSEMELNLENITMKANKVRDSILEFLGLKVTTDPITGEQIIQWDKQKALDNIMDFFDTMPGKIALLVGSLALLGGAFSLGIPASVIGTIVGIGSALGLLLSQSEPFATAFTGLFTQVGISLQLWGTTLSGVFSQVGIDLITMWNTHILPTIEAIGTMLAPALETLGSLWGNLSVIINDIFTLIGSVWTTVLKPALEGAMTIIQDLCVIIQDWWEKYFGPVFEYIGDGIETLWTEKIKPTIDKIIEIIGKLIELFMALWNTVLKPLIEWIGKVLGPVFVAVFKSIWDGISWAIGLAMGIIKSLLESLEGIIDFLVGTFTGDWERAWKGLVNIFVGIGNMLISIFEGVVNGIIWLINSLIELVWQAIQGVINALGGAVEAIAEVLGFKLDLTLNAQVPDIPKVSIPRIPAMATGGVVTGPTHLIAGEGKYSEAILPLDDSPQMNDLINKIVEEIDKDDNPNPQPVEVKVYIGDKEYDAYTYKASERGKKIVGKQPVKIGG